MEAKINNVENSEKHERTKRNFRFLDILVLIVFISTAVLGLYLFRNDLMQTLEMRGMEPVGTIVIKQNIVQRRHEDRTIWDRLFVESPVYNGDLIRVADLSAASVFFDDNQLNVNENTIIRIQALTGARGGIEVELQEGNISLTTQEADGSGGKDSVDLLINLMGNRVQASSGTVLNAAVSDEGMSVQVNEGSASFIENDPQGTGQAARVRELSEGAMIAKDSRGMERSIPAAVVTRPKPNVRYLKPNADMLPVNFSWRRINLTPENKLRLDISMDRSFTNDVISIDDLDSSTQAFFDTGVWYWRIVFNSEGIDLFLSRGEIAVIDSSGPELLSPVIGSVIRYGENPPQVRFQWNNKPEASNYLLEVSSTPQFTTRHLTSHVSSNSLIQSGIEEGLWYWRVKPVFSSAYEGTSEYSAVSSFSIEKVLGLQAAAQIEIPEPEVVAAIKAELPAPPSAPSPSAPLRGAPGSESALQAQTAAIPTLTRQRAPEPVYHTVVSGDTLGGIADLFYKDWTQWPRISDANNISNPNLIFPGQVFLIP